MSVTEQQLQVGERCVLPDGRRGVLVEIGEFTFYVRLDPDSKAAEGELVDFDGMRVAMVHRSRVAK